MTMDRTPTTIKNMRLIRGMSQAAFASALGVSVSAIKQWERGNNCISPENIGRIKKFLMSEYDDPTPDDIEYVNGTIMQLISDKLQ